MVGRWTNFVTKYYSKTAWKGGEKMLWQNGRIKEHGK